MDLASIASLGQFTPCQSISSWLQPPDSVLNLLPHLPKLHLSLLISAARLNAIHNATVMTFSLVYTHFADLVSRARLQASAAGSIAQATKLWSHDVAAGAWRELAEWEIVLPVAGKGTERREKKMWKCDVVLEEIIGAVGRPDAWMSDMMIRWCKEV
jgi:Origin recognition complex (ORC) subunit 4 C-terminus